MKQVTWSGLRWIRKSWYAPCSVQDNDSRCRHSNSSSAPAGLRCCQFFHDHHVRSQARIDERIHAIKSATPLTDDLAVIRPHQLLVLALVEQLRVTLRAIASFDAEFRALPGAGAALAP